MYLASHDSSSDLDQQYEKYESTEASFEEQSQYNESEYMDDAYPTDSEISYDEPDHEINMRPLDWDSRPLAISRSSTSVGWAQENHSFTALGLANPIPQEAARPRPKQTARKSSMRRSVSKAQTVRKQTARKSQSTGKTTKSVTKSTSAPAPTTKAKAKAKSTPKPKPKTQGAQKKTPAKAKSAKSKKGAAQETILEFNGEKYQCRLEVRPSGS